MNPREKRVSRNDLIAYALERADTLRSGWQRTLS